MPNPIDPAKSMERIALYSLLAAVLALAGCNPKSKEEPAQPSPTPVQATQATPPPTPEPAPAAPQANQDAQVIVLCYHRIEGEKGGPLSISAEQFEQELQAIKDAGIQVISMADFLAWKRGEKTIPPRAAIITIDDGYASGYSVGWPILKKFGYPFTMYVYTNFVNSGGKSITWQQLEEMRDDGVDIASHTLSHSDLKAGKKGKTDEEYVAWLQSEMAGSKKIIEDKLGIRVTTLAFPYGVHNETVRKVGMEAGYDALFSVYGQKIGFGSPNDQIGRYAIEAKKPEIFKTAITFGDGTAPAAGPVVAQMAAASMITQPKDGEVINTSTPLIKANLATFGDIDPQSVQMRLSGVGLVPSKYDPQSKNIEYQVTEKLRDPNCTVIVTAKNANGSKKLETRWSFKVGP